MDEQKAREILGNKVKPGNLLYHLAPYISLNTRDKQICLDGDFTADELEALAWWIRNFSK